MKVEVEYELARNVRKIARLDIAGGGQIVVEGGYAYVGHMKPPMGTSIIDVRDPAKPVVVAHIEPPDEYSHTHKVRVVGNIMITNVEQDRRHPLRRGEKIAGLRAEGLSDKEIAAKLNLKAADLPNILETLARGYDMGGFRIWDISDKTVPKLLSYVKTHGFGVHRFDMDDRYAYISTEMEGYVGNILVTYDISDPSNPTDVSRWHMDGQHLAGGEVPTWDGYGVRLHHAMRCGDELWAAVWHAGFRVLDATDMSNPKVIGSYRFQPGIPEPTHTVMPMEQLIDGRRYAVVIDEEHDHLPGRLHGFIWVMDVTDLNNMVPVSAWDLTERASPWVGQPGVRFGGHQFREKLDSTLIYATWFAGGLRVLDLADPHLPVEVAHYIPEPGQGGPAQSNDVDVDENGLIYVLDRNNGVDILEMKL